MCLIRSVFVCLCVYPRVRRCCYWLQDAGSAPVWLQATNLRPTHTDIHTASVEVYGGNAVVTTGNALSANLPYVRLPHFLSLEVQSNKLHLLY